VDVASYCKNGFVEEDGELWYYNGDGSRQRASVYIAKNKSRMFVNGKYIPKSHPLHKPGSYKTLDDAWSHMEINEKSISGDIYLIVNPAWPDWVKVGKAAFANDRLSNYQTSSPFRDYEILHAISVENMHDQERIFLRLFEEKAEDAKGEWFKIEREKAVELLAL